MTAGKNLYPDGELGRIKEDLESRFQETAAQCPYKLPYKAVYKQGRFHNLPDRLLEVFLRAGYRRNGNIIYAMTCPECRACVPIRLAPKKFRPNRNQKRVIKRNRDLTVEILPPQMGNEQLELCRKFLAARYPESGCSPEEYYSGFFINSMCTTLEVQYRLAGSLIGTGIIDLSPEWMNCVYFYFDPEAGRRSPGIYNILYLLNFCRLHNINFLYLGYWLKEVRAMRYKAGFSPHQLLINGHWRTVPLKGKKKIAAKGLSL